MCLVIWLKRCSTCRCPIAGLKETFRNCQRAYRSLNASKNFSYHFEPVGHAVTEAMDALVETFFEKHLQPGLVR